MSTVALSTITSALATLFEDQIASAINRATVILQVLPVGYGTTGKNITWAARFGSVAPGARGGVQLQGVPPVARWLPPPRV